ncbi:urease accessory protein UreD [Zhongshania aliphaticivorans]|uniref:urease accessory protein UreD n=1 Tax=Zhongshania aliphaticivorans TaxID=1470434 RepID=UPI0012E6ED8A|nr:urease accessory protein UreD [Zhongshania aliphaticivorans]MBU0537379.1 urease accessory protein UreD [Gammaproteobacteria bacterium]MBU1834042.1 urease accessory protein UreD [Gammaproteobacteria bacterium]CAA0118301.1 Urease accessory protein UreD [Zhongshania aliphaticivorans]
MIPAPDEVSSKSWRASIELTFEARAGRTDLVRSRHKGPLRVQRAFYPEGDCCHLYLLHPPGGMVPGDDLRVALGLSHGAQALLTTPSAGKVYRSDLAKTTQSQGISATLLAGTCLEWLPQETIVYEGAEAELSNSFDLHGDASLCAWDIVVLGRRASGEGFSKGRCLQKIEISRDGIPLLHERTEWLGGSKMLDAPWGMHGMSVSGTLFATLQCDQDRMDSLREGLAELVASRGWLPAEWGLSQKRDIFLARYVGNSPEQCRKGFIWLWSQLRPLLNGRAACPPRIWNT